MSQKVSTHGYKQEASDGSDPSDQSETDDKDESTDDSPESSRRSDENDQSGSSEDVEDLNDKLEGMTVSAENDGTFITEHQWGKRTPKDVKEQRFKHLVSKSKEYEVSAKWIKNKKLDLKAVYDALPDFVGEMTNRRAKSQRTQPTELQQEHSDKPSYHQEPFKASSLSEDKNYVFLDCEHLLRMYLPGSSSSWFKVDEYRNWKRVSSVAEDHKSKRWVFTPSYRRAKIALLNWPGKDDEEISRAKTLRILVVRPSEFHEYVARCGDLFPVISLPNEGIGVGYARLWIQKIALHLGLKFIWMIDDSIECFYENNPAESLVGKGSYRKRRRKFGLIFKHIESLVIDEKPTVAMKPIVAMKQTKSGKKPVVAMKQTKSDKKPIVAMKQTKSDKKPIVAMKPTKSDKKPIVAMKPTKSDKKPVVAMKPTKSDKKPIVAMKPTKSDKKPIVAMKPTVAMKQTKSDKKPIVAMKQTKSDKPIVAMSPTRFRGLQPTLQKPFICKPPQGAVFLNLEKLSSKNVFYRPELPCVEDMLFAYECEQNGLKVFVDQRFQLQDHRWTNSGARQRPLTKLAPKKAQTI